MTSRHFENAEREKINVKFLPAASFSCLITDIQKGLKGLRRFTESTGVGKKSLRTSDEMFCDICGKAF